MDGPHPFPQLRSCHWLQVNIGMQFVKAGRYAEAINFLAAVLRQYRLEPLKEFCAGQIAIKEVLRLGESYDTQLAICGQVITCELVVFFYAGRSSTYLRLLQSSCVALFGWSSLQ